MALFLLTCMDHPGGLDRRMATREAHLAYVSAQEPGVMKIGGPFLDDAGQMIGSLIVIDVPDLAAAEAWTKNDPYNKQGVFQSVDIKPFKLTIGQFA